MKSLQNWLHNALYLGTIFYALHVIFQVQHWPFASLLFYIAFAVLTIGTLAHCFWQKSIALKVSIPLLLFIACITLAKLFPKSTASLLGYTIAALLYLWVSFQFFSILRTENKTCSFRLRLPTM